MAHTGRSRAGTRGLRRRRGPHTGRQARRRVRQGPPRRPGRRRDPGAARAHAVASTRPGSARSTSAPRTSPVRTTATSPGCRRCWPVCPRRCPARRSTGSARSGLDAVVGAARTIAVGDASIMVAGGVESMTRAPYVLPKPERPFPAGNATMYSTTLGWRMTNPDMPDGLDRQPRREHRAARREVRRRPRGRRRVRRPQSTSARPQAWAGRRVRRRRSSQVPGAELTRDEGIRDGRHPRVARRAQAVVPRRRHRHRRQRLPALRRRRRAAARRRGRRRRARRRAAGPDHRDRRRRRRPAVLRHRPGAGRRPRAGQGRPHATRDVTRAWSSTRRSPRSRWPASPSGPTSTPSWSTRTAARSRSGTRSAARAPGSPVPVAHQLDAAGSGVGVAALCIGVGQGLALTMER